MVHEKSLRDVAMMLYGGCRLCSVSYGHSDTPCMCVSDSLCSQNIAMPDSDSLFLMFLTYTYV
jgi:hypothetical protein